MQDVVDVAEGCGDRRDLRRRGRAGGRIRSKFDADTAICAKQLWASIGISLFPGYLKILPIMQAILPERRKPLWEP